MDAEIPEADDATTGAATETAASRDAAAPSPPEIPQAEAHVDAPGATAGAGETVVTAPSADQLERPSSPTAS